MMTATVCFEQKTTICNAKFGDLGDNGVRGSKYVVDSAIFGIADPDLPIHYATFIYNFIMGLQWWLRVVYSWVSPLLSDTPAQIDLYFFSFNEKFNISHFHLQSLDSQFLP